MTNGIDGTIDGIGIEYENTFVETKLRLGLVPDFKLLPKEVDVNNPISKDIEDMYLERMAYLINIDDVLEELLA